MHLLQEYMPGVWQVIAYLICLAQLLKALVCRGVAPVLVWVVPARYAQIRHHNILADATYISRI